MSISRQADFRSNQKERTRAALVEAATALLRQGTPPTVAEAAEHARVSRATAYRYFPTQEALLVEITSLTPLVAPVEEALTTLQTNDVEERLHVLVDTLNPLVVSEEIATRSALRVYLDTWFEGHANGDTPPVREGRRMRWLERVLEPVRPTLTDEQYRRLCCALALTLSIDAVVVMKDVCRVDTDGEALDVLRWAATALLRAGLDEAAPSPDPTR
jgi:AcrR family transcriptional regulator